MTLPSGLGGRLAEIVGERHTRLRPGELAVYAQDGLPSHDSPPGAVVLPGSREEVIAVVKLLYEAGVPWVARGAGTGLSGGAVASPDSVIIGLTRLTRILDLSVPGRRAVVEPGVVNARLSAYTIPHGLVYAPDPSSQSACTLGGNVAENAGGPHCLKYGVTTNHILALEVVLSNGDVVQLGSPSGDAWGPDLVGLFVGSEGMFGIATRITLRLVPVPEATRTYLADFGSVRAASESVSAIVATGVVPAALEMMDQACVRAVEASIYAAGYPTDAAAVLIVELDGSSEGVAADSQVVAPLLAAHGARQLRVADDVAERARLWQGRKKAFGAMGRIAPDLAVQDAVVPRSVLPDVLDRIGVVGERHELTVSNVFHAGDGNLHPNISFDRRDARRSAQVHSALSEIMQICVAEGGTLTGEHGVGSDKRDYMPLVFSATSLDAMCRVRRAWDPLERANPGKVLPLNSCREWRAGGVE